MLNVGKWKCVCVKEKERFTRKTKRDSFALLAQLKFLV